MCVSRNAVQIADSFYSSLRFIVPTLCRLHYSLPMVPIYLPAYGGNSIREIFIASIIEHMQETQRTRQRAALSPHLLGGSVESQLVQRALVQTHPLHVGELVQGGRSRPCGLDEDRPDGGEVGNAGNVPRQRLVEPCQLRQYSAHRKKMSIDPVARKDVLFHEHVADECYEALLAKLRTLAQIGNVCMVWCMF